MNICFHLYYKCLSLVVKKYNHLNLSLHVMLFSTFLKQKNDDEEEVKIIS